ncbi:MAG TPA: site-specific integrase, partial [Sphingorhabdus sp.]|nr:site-specific integrase [Sphingorhabdus sp.]
FGIRHYATGRNVYIVQTRMAGRLRTITIGPASVITRHQATIVARRVIAYAQVGLDPATERKRIRSAPRFDDFLEEYWQRWSPHWKASTYDTHEKYRRLYLDDAFPGIFIDALNEADVTKWFANLNNRIGPGGANRVMSILNNMLNKAESWGYRLENTNPCRAVRLNRKRRCERFLSRAELERLGEVLARMRAGEDPVRSIAATAVALLLLTGCRAGEITSLQWQDVRGNRLKLRDSKTGPRTVWLGDEARALIDSLPKHKKIVWLFWNWRYRKPLRDITHYWHEIRAEAGLHRVRLHDLRHTFASHAAMNKETLPMIGRLLGHTNPQSTARYAHLDDEHVLDAVEQIGTAIERLLA